MNLEKLIGLSEGEQDQVRGAFSYRRCNPKRERHDLPYLKYDLTKAIVQAIISASDVDEQGRFDKNLYGTVRKEPLKRVNYGIRSTGNLPFNFLTALTNWERVYFFRGRWAIQNPNLDEPTEVVTAKHVLEGVGKLYQDHYVRKADGQYVSDINLPEDAEIRKQCRQVIGDYRRKKEEPKKPKLKQKRLF